MSRFTKSRRAFSSLILRSQDDVFLVYAAAREGQVPLLDSALTLEESMSLSCGDIYVWKVQEGGFKWRDNRKWGKQHQYNLLIWKDEICLAPTKTKSWEDLRRITHSWTIETDSGEQETWRLAAFINRAWIEKGDRGSCRFVNEDPHFHRLKPGVFIKSNRVGTSRASIAPTARGRSRSKSVCPKLRNRPRPAAPGSNDRVQQSEENYRRNTRSQSRGPIRHQSSHGDSWKADGDWLNYLGESVGYLIFTSNGTARIEHPPVSCAARFAMKDGDLYVHRTQAVDSTTGKYLIPELSVWVWVEKHNEWIWTPTNGVFVHPSEGLEAIRLTINNITLKPKWIVRGKHKGNILFDNTLKQARKRTTDEAALDEEVRGLSMETTGPQGQDQSIEVIPATPPPERQRPIREKIAQPVKLSSIAHVGLGLSGMMIFLFMSIIYT
ncbi:hypothetical protein FRB93_012578 [Tulasnella sp. JGI-2019a]|nr:hypothetical protein FRB93_012578 [Tulasnella sp. JGI-2019a]